MEIKTTVTVEITDELVEDIINDIGDLDIMLTPAYVKKFLKKHKDLAVDIAYSDYDEKSQEDFIQQLAVDLTGLPWPLCTAGRKTKNRFNKALREGIKGTDIKLPENWSL